MYIISLEYIVPLDVVDKHLNEHVAYLEEQYELGNFLLSGRKMPRTGGIIISNIKERSELDEVINQDPFKIHDLANYEITHFEPSMAANELVKYTAS